MVGSVTVALCSASIVSACDKSQSNTTASTKSSSASGFYTSEMGGTCKSKKSATATTASMDHCAGKGAKASNAVMASVSADHCGGKAKASASAYTASAGGSCVSHKGVSATHAMAARGGAFAVPAGASCGGKGVGTMAGNSAHGSCDACSDMAMCEGELKSAGSQYQVVPLKNGIMYVYSAVNARGVRAVQTAIARRTERMNSIASAEKATLCPDCKAMRGALASGKLNREIVNVEGGSISLVTSDDPGIVAKLYAMAGVN